MRRCSTAPCLATMATEGPAGNSGLVYKLGAQAKDTYNFYVVITSQECATLMQHGVVRLGSYTPLRQDAPELGYYYNGIAEAIARNEYMTGVPFANWPAAWLHQQARAVSLKSVGCAGCHIRRCRPTKSRVMLKVAFTAVGYAHFVHWKDLTQSWEGWWRVHGDLHLTCVDTSGTVLYTTQVVQKY
jgi:hypothetical protein